MFIIWIKEHIVFLVVAIVALGCGSLLALARLNAPPANFPIASVFHIDQGEPVATILTRLQAQSLVRSPRFLQVSLRVLNTDHSITPGDYYFPHPIGALALAGRITRGDFGIAQAKVTIPEGSTVREIATILKAGIPELDIQGFLTFAQPHEGYLFPDTYFFSSLEKPAAIVERMRNTFEQVFAPYAIAATTTKKTKEEIVVMASLIEKETKFDADRPRVAGILWKRIELGMPLQVDAPFFYLLRKTSTQLTKDDLALESRYNTYRYKGLPVGPIGNPGVKSIKAALFPEASPYLYYLSDKNGVLHYATDLDGHKQNRALYLH